MKTLKNAVIQLINCMGLIIILSSMSYQEKDLLINKRWDYVFPIEQKYERYISFSETEQTATIDIGYDKADMINKYYLSETADDKFDEKKNGKNKTGKFILVNAIRKDGKGNKYNELEVWEILELTENYMKLKNYKNNQIDEYKKAEE